MLKLPSGYLVRTLNRSTPAYSVHLLISGNHPVSLEIPPRFLNKSDRGSSGKVFGSLSSSLKLYSGIIRIKRIGSEILFLDRLDFCCCLHAASAKAQNATKKEHIEGSKAVT